jgi:hypothetical protein
MAALLLVGCDTYHHEQYKIRRAASAGDRAKLKHVLGSVASTSGLHDCNAISRAQHTVALYCELDVIPYSGAQLGARKIDDFVVVDLLHSLGSQTRAYDRAHQLLEPALVAAFGERVATVNPLQEVAPTQPTRSNPAMQRTAGRSAF